jgi:hypothetical protein
MPYVYSLTMFVCFIESVKLKWGCYVDHEETTNAYKIVVGKYRRKCDPQRSCDRNFSIGLKLVHRIELAMLNYNLKSGYYVVNRIIPSSQSVNTRLTYLYRITIRLIYLFRVSYVFFIYLESVYVKVK